MLVDCSQIHGKHLITASEWENFVLLNDDVSTKTWHYNWSEMAFWPSGHVNGVRYVVLLHSEVILIWRNVDWIFLPICFCVLCEICALDFREVKPYNQDDMKTSHR